MTKSARRVQNSGIIGQWAVNPYILVVNGGPVNLPFRVSLAVWVLVCALQC